MSLNKNNDPLTLEKIYIEAAQVALAGGDGERFFLEQAHAQGVDIPDRLRGYYITKLKHYKWSGRKTRANRTVAVILAALLFAACAVVLIIARSP